MKTPLKSSDGSSAAVGGSRRAVFYRRQAEHPDAERIAAPAQVLQMQAQTYDEEATPLEAISPALAGQAKRIAVRVHDRILLLDAKNVLSVQAEGNYVLLQSESESYLVRETISMMAKKLRPNGFIQIHRSLLINVAGVEEIQPCGTGEYIVQMRGGKRFTATRTYKNNLKSLAKVWIGADRFLED